MDNISMGGFNSDISEKLYKIEFISGLKFGKKINQRYKDIIFKLKLGKYNNY